MLAASSIIVMIDANRSGNVTSNALAARSVSGP